MYGTSKKPSPKKAGARKRGKRSKKGKKDKKNSPGAGFGVEGQDDDDGGDDAEADDEDDDSESTDSETQRQEYAEAHMAIEQGWYQDQYGAWHQTHDDSNYFYETWFANQHPQSQGPVMAGYQNTWGFPPVPPFPIQSQTFYGDGGCHAWCNPFS